MSKQFSARFSRQDRFDIERIMRELGSKNFKELVLTLKDSYMGKRVEDGRDKVSPTVISNQQSSTLPTIEDWTVKCNARFFDSQGIAYCKPFSKDKKPRKLISPSECEACFRVRVGVVIDQKEPKLYTAPTRARGNHYMTEDYDERSWRVP